MQGWNMLEVNANNFETEVRPSKVPVVVDFYANWCSPCKALAPTFEKVAKQFEGKMKFAKCDVDTNQEFAQAAGVMGIPCILVFKSGEEVGRIVGNQTEDSLKQQLNALL